MRNAKTKGDKGHGNFLKSTSQVKGPRAMPIAIVTIAHLVGSTGDGEGCTVIFSLKAQNPLKDGFQSLYLFEDPLPAA